MKENYRKTKSDLKYKLPDERSTTQIITKAIIDHHPKSSNGHFGSTLVAHIGDAFKFQKEETTVWMGWQLILIVKARSTRISDDGAVAEMITEPSAIANC